MSTRYDQAASYLAEVLATRSVDELAARLRPKPGLPAARLPRQANVTAEVVARHWAALDASEKIRNAILDAGTASCMAAYERNIERFVGTVKVPVGVIGPLRVNGLFAQGDYYVPLATTEAALVASYGRGASVITDAGGASAMVVNEGVGRSPAFGFSNLEEAGRFLIWVLGQGEAIRRCAESTTRHGKLVDVQFTIEGNHVYALMLYRTGDAAGQNMATIATDAAVRWLVAQSPVKPERTYIEANLSGDKKATLHSLQAVRGKKATAEVVIPAAIVQARLHASPAAIVAFASMAGVGGTLSGTIGVQGHFANGLAALFIACGQDAACVAEAATGVTRFEETAAGDLYVAVTLPNLIVGTVGGGTGLPSQRACLELMGLYGAGHARAFAEVVACVCLAGEISIAAAITAGEFVQAHVRFARR